MWGVHHFNLLQTPLVMPQVVNVWCWFFLLHICGDLLHTCNIHSPTDCHLLSYCGHLKNLPWSVSFFLQYSYLLLSIPSINLDIAIVSWYSNVWALASLLYTMTLPNSNFWRNLLLGSHCLEQSCVAQFLSRSDEGRHKGTCRYRCEEEIFWILLESPKTS